MCGNVTVPPRVSGAQLPGSHRGVSNAAVRKAVREVLGTSWFRRTKFRPGQAEAIEAVLQRDTLAVLASGTGKTLIYTVAAKLIGKRITRVDLVQY